MLINLCHFSTNRVLFATWNGTARRVGGCSKDLVADAGSTRRLCWRVQTSQLADTGDQGLRRRPISHSAFGLSQRRGCTISPSRELASREPVTWSGRKRLSRTPRESRWSGSGCLAYHVRRQTLPVVIDVKDWLAAQEHRLELYAEGITELADCDVLRDHIDRFDDLWLGELGIQPVP